MLKGRWILVALALVAVGALVRVVIASRTRSPDGLLQSARERIAGEAPDWNGALRELRLALELADENGDEEAAREILLERAGVYERRGDFELALRDADRILQRYAPNDGKALLIAAKGAGGVRKTDLALEYLSRRLRTEPRDALALALAGDNHRRLADEALDLTRARLDAELAEGPTEEAMAWARMAAALPPGAPRRAAAFDSLGTFLRQETDRRRAIGYVEAASGHMAASREAYLASLASAPTERAVAGLQQHLLDAGNLEDAADLGLACLRTPGMPRGMPILTRTVEALIGAQRAPAAALVVRSYARSQPIERQYSGLKADELAAWCLTLHEQRLWPELMRAARALEVKRSTAFVGWPQFFKGIAELRLRLPARAIGDFARIRNRIVPAPFPEADLYAECMRAEAVGMQPRGSGAERFFLSRLQERFPLEPETELMERTIGEAWLRLGRYQWGEKNAAHAERSLSHALRLLPNQRATIGPLWHLVGRAAMEARGRNLDGLLGALRRRTNLLVAANAGPFERWAVADWYFDHGREAEAVEIQREVLEEYPGLPPMLEVQARSLLRLRDYVRAADLLFGLADSGWLDPRKDPVFRSLPYEALTPEQRLQWIKYSPRERLLYPMAQRLIESGRKDLALRALSANQPQAWSPEERALATRLYSELGLWEACYEIAVTIPARDAGFTTSIALGVEAALRMGPQGPDKDPVREMIKRLAGAPSLEGDELVDAVDALFANHRTDDALRILRIYDKSSNAPSATLLLRLALAHLLRGELRMAAETLDRSEAFLTDGAPSVGRVLVAASAREWDAAKTATVELFDAGFASTPYRNALLLGLSGQPDFALDALERPESDGDTFDPLQLLAKVGCAGLLPSDSARAAAIREEPIVAGAADLVAADRPNALDPHELLALLLALESRPWSAWALARLEGLPPELAQSPWMRMLGALSLVHLGAVERAETVLETLVGPDDDVVGAAELLARLKQERQETLADPKFLQVKEKRILRLGPGAGSKELDFLTARSLELNGDLRGAVRVLDEALRRQPDDIDLVRERTRLQLESDELEGALDGYRRLFDLLPAAEADPLVLEYVELLRRAARRGVISDSAWWALLESLATRRPRDPELALELARRTIETADQGRDFGVLRAWERLERFRLATLYEPIESLRRGEARRWAELYWAHDPKKAREFVRGEYVVQPESPELWILWGEAQERAGGLVDAFFTYQTLSIIAPQPAIERHACYLMAQLGVPANFVMAAIVGLIKKEQGSQPDSELSYVQGIALLNGLGGKQASQAIQKLEYSWAQRAEPGAPPANDIARAYLRALLERGSREDARRARELVAGLAPRSELEHAVLRGLDSFAAATLKALDARDARAREEKAAAEQPAQAPEGASGGAPGE